MTPKKRKTEQKAHKLIYDAGEGVYLQSELWKILDITNREASRIVKKFMEKGSIRRERVLNNGRWTYRIFPLKESVSLDSIEGCPCLVCPNVDKCFRGGKNDPTKCMNLTAWVDPRIKPLTINNI